MDALGEDQPEREFLIARHRVKTGEELDAATANEPLLFTEEAKTVYLGKSEQDQLTEYEKVVRRGELYNMDPESTKGFVEFNQQVTDEQLKDLREKCTTKQFVEVVRLLPEFNFSAEEVWKHVKNKTKPSPLFECGVRGCLRSQERWQARVLHGCYPQEDMKEFQHDSTDTKPSCYFVNYMEGTLISEKYKDVLPIFAEIDYHRTGKEKRLLGSQRRSTTTPSTDDVPRPRKRSQSLASIPKKTTDFLDK